VPSLTSYIVQTLLVLIGLGALAWILVAARRPSMAKGAERGALGLIGRLPLEGRRAVYVVRVGDKVLVLGGSEAGVTKLAEMPGDQFPAELPAPSGQLFGDVLSRVIGKGRPAPSSATATPSATLGREAEESGATHG